MNLHVGVFVALQLTLNGITLHGEEANFGVDGHALDHHALPQLLEIPNHLFQTEGNLLARLEGNNVFDPFFFNRRQLHKPHQAALARHGYGQMVALPAVSLQESFQRLTDERILVSIGLTKDFGMFDVIEVGGNYLAIALFQADRLQAALPQVQAPNTFIALGGRLFDLGRLGLFDLGFGGGCLGALSANGFFCGHGSRSRTVCLIDPQSRHVSRLLPRR